MKSDEFAFVNQQLAGMLKSGIPLEGALRQLCATMKSGPLRTELAALETDLAGGVPLGDALGRRRLPELYVHLIRVGVQGDDLPGVLNLLADHYQRLHSIAARLKALLVYPLIVLIAGLLLSLALSCIISTVVSAIGEADYLPSIAPFRLALWTMPGLLALFALAVLTIVAVPQWRRAWRDWLPGFKEARLAQIASALSLMLERGGRLNDALSLAERLEQGTVAGAELAQWQTRLAGGHGKITDFAQPGRFFPPLFIWLVASAGENLAAGFGRAAQLFHARASHRVEMMLYAFLPVSVMVLGLMLVGQAYPAFRVLTGFMNALGDMGGM